MAQLELLKSPPPHLAGAHQKSDSAYRTISEVADELDVPQHVLRFWESHFPQVKPSRMRGSRRYYRPEDVETLHKIKTLLYEKGFTIKGAKKFIRGKDEDGLMETSVPPALPQQALAPKAAAPEKKAHKEKEKADVQNLISELRVLKAMLTTLL